MCATENPHFPTVPVVFAISRQAANELLINKGAAADEKQSREVWLLRESSVPGLLTLLSYNKETKKFVNMRYGYKNNAWQQVSANDDEAKKFLNESTTFFATTSQKDKQVAAKIPALLVLLDTQGFKPKDMIYPQNEEEQSTKYQTESLEHKTNYVELDNDGNNKNPSSRR